MIEEKSIVDLLAKRQEEREKQQEVIVENIEEYKLSLNRIFAMNEGKILAKYMLRFSGVFADDNQLNPAKLIEDKGKRAYYLKMIRPFLDPQLRMELENL